jgi:hypothetical protein
MVEATMATPRSTRALAEGSATRRLASPPGGRLLRLGGGLRVFAKANDERGRGLLRVGNLDHGEGLLLLSLTGCTEVKVLAHAALESVADDGSLAALVTRHVVVNGHGVHRSVGVVVIAIFDDHLESEGLSGGREQSNCLGQLLVKAQGDHLSLLLGINVLEAYLLWVNEARGKGVR